MAWWHLGLPVIVIQGKATFYLPRRGSRVAEDVRPLAEPFIEI